MHQQALFPSTTPPLGNPLIISASRRTDLPGFYPRQCAQLIEEKIARLRSRYYYGTVFWTRHVKPFLKGQPLHHLVADNDSNALVNLTVTGLGGSKLEPGVPTTKAILSAIPSLVTAFKVAPWRIRWRFDPLIKGQSTIGLFEHIAQVMTFNGIHDCIISFPSAASLKGPLITQYQQHSILSWSETEKDAFLQQLIATAQKHSIRLLACCQPDICRRHPQIFPAACIDSELLERGHRHHIPLNLNKDRSQRTHCHCIQSDDIGNYTIHPCRGGCVYCYSRAGGPDNFQGESPLKNGNTKNPNSNRYRKSPQSSNS